MERPNHDLQLIAQGSKEGKALSLAITIAIQVGVILALVAGLAASCGTEGLAQKLVTSGCRAF